MLTKLCFACIVIALLPTPWAAPLQPTQTGVSIPCVKDLPCDEAFTDNVKVPPDSLIIPMDNGYYNTNPALRGAETSNGVFNPKVYGAIVRLLWADVPVAWLIRGGKTKSHSGGSWTDPIDFTKNVAQILPSKSTSPSLRHFRGGAFLVTASYRAQALEILRKYNEDLATGQLYLGPNFNNGAFGSTPSYSGGTQVNVYKLASSGQPSAGSLPSELRDFAGYRVPIYHLLVSKPYAAVFDSADFGKVYIQTKYMEDAGLVRDNWLAPNGQTRPYLGINSTVCPECIEGAHYRVMSSADAANSLNEESCLSFVSEPHFHYLDEGNPWPVQNFLSSMRNFLKSGGNSLMECGGIYTYEQCDIRPEGGGNPGQCITSDQGGMFSTAGIVKGTGTACEAIGEFDMPHSDLPISQFTGAWECVGGSVNRWKFSGSSQFLDTATKKSHSILGEKASNGNFFVGGGKIDRTRETGGTFAYLAGHDYAKAASKSGAPGARIYLNAVLLPAQRAPECGLTITDGGDGGKGDGDDDNAAAIAGGTLGTLAGVGVCLAGICCVSLVLAGIFAGAVFLLMMAAAIPGTTSVVHSVISFVGADDNPLYSGQTAESANPLYA